MSTGVPGHTSKVAPERSNTIVSLNSDEAPPSADAGDLPREASSARTARGLEKNAKWGLFITQAQMRDTVSPLGSLLFSALALKCWIPSPHSLPD